MITLERLKFDPADADEGPHVGSYITTTNGVVTSTTDGGAERLHVDADISGLSNPSEFGIYDEDSAAVSGSKGMAILAVRNDTQSSLVDTDGDLGHLQLDSVGRLRVVADLDLTGDLTDDGSPDNEDPLKVGGHAYAQSSVWGAIDSGDKGNLAMDLYRRTLINFAPNVAGSSEAISVTDTAGGTALGTASAGRMRQIVQNQGDKSVWVGFGALSETNGIEIGKGDSIEIEIGEGLTLKAFVPTANSPQEVRVMHWG